MAGRVQEELWRGEPRRSCGGKSPGGVVAGRVQEGRVVVGRVQKGRVVAGRVQEGRVVVGRVQEGGLWQEESRSWPGCGRKSPGGPGCGGKSPGGGLWQEEARRRCDKSRPTFAKLNPGLHSTSYLVLVVVLRSGSAIPLAT